MKDGIENLPVKGEATLEQALRWVAYGQPPLPENIQRMEWHEDVLQELEHDFEWIYVPGNGAGSAADKLLSALARGLIEVSGLRHSGSSDEPSYAEGLDVGVQKIKAIELDRPYCWRKGIIKRNGNTLFSGLRLSFSDLQRVFPDPYYGERTYFSDENSSGTEGAPKKEQRKGRPPLVERDVWLTELVKLYHANQIERTTGKEAIATMLREKLMDAYDVEVAVDTIRKDWLGPLFQK